MLKKIALALTALTLFASAATAQVSTATNTQTPTVTPTNTPTNTNTPTLTPTFPLAVKTLTRQQRQRIEGSAPGAKFAGMNAILDAVVKDTNDSVKAAVVTGVTAALLPVYDTVTTVVAVVQFNSNGTVTLLALTTDYTVAGGKITTVGAGSNGLSLLVLYKR